MTHSRGGGRRRPLRCVPRNLRPCKETIMSRSAVFAGLLVVFLLAASILLMSIQRTRAVTHDHGTTMPMNMPMPATGAPSAGASLALTSYAGVTGDNPDALAAAHTARDATLPA